MNGNSIDPLAQLRDIHLPEAVGLWPLAWGWWLLIGLLLATSAGTLLWLWRRHRARAHRRAAAAALDAALVRYMAGGEARQYLLEHNRLLKRAAIGSFGRAAVARLHGREWAAFLDRQWPRTAPVEGGFAAFPFDAMLYAPGDAGADSIHSLHALSKDWLQRHRGGPR